MSKLMKFASKLVIAALAISFVGAASPAQAAQTGDLTVKIHYARQAGDFTGRYAWVWFAGTNAAGTFTGTGIVTANGGAWIPVNNSGVDSYGAVSTFTLTGGKNIDKFGIIECSTNSWTNNCGRDAASAADRFITVSSLNTEVWLRSGSSASVDTTIYTSDSLAPYTATSQIVKVHYNRTDGNYSGWKLHLGTESKLMASTYWVSPADYDFTAANPVGYSAGSDQFGAFIQTTLPYYAGQTKTMNMVVYSLDVNNAWVKDGGNVDGNRYLAADASGVTNIWLVSGDTTGTAAFATEPVIATPTPTPTATATPTAT
ncbi:MAG: pullulanase-associated domain-containing protein, partial [Actinomycetes bacterium]